MLGSCWNDKDKPCGKCYGCWYSGLHFTSINHKLKSGTMLTSICLFDY